MADNDPLIGTQLGDYKIADVIGHGGMGRVYRGFDEKLERYSAVKVFDAKGFQGDEMEEYRARFQREARAIARLKHPNIVGVYQFGQAGDSLHYMAMVYIDGRDLRTIIREKAAKNEQLKPEAILRIVTDVASALDYAHEQKVIHRDIKPSNVMVMEDGHAVLTDFGLVLNVSEGTIGTTFGSVHYIAPEQALDSAKAVPQSDMYSLGIVLYEMLTGRVPFEDQSAMNVALKHVRETPPPPRKYNPDISPELEAVVLRTLSKEPDQRYPDGNSFVQALENAFGLIDEDEHTRRVVIPDWAKAVGKANGKADDRPAAPVDKPGPTPRPDIPAPVIAEPQDDTLDEKSETPKPPVAVRINRWRNLIGIGVTVVVVLVGLLVLTGLGGNNLGDEIAAPATGTPAAVAVIEATATDEPTARPRATLANLSTEQPTETPVQSTETSTNVPPTPTIQPSASPTIRPTHTSTRRPAPIESGMQVPARLVFDDDMFLLINESNEVMDVSNITFVQVVEAGDDLTFSSSRWTGGGVSIDALPIGDCFQIYTTNVGVGDTPESCEVRHKWDQASFVRWFWVSEVPGAQFEVRRQDSVIGECQISLGECVVDMQPGSPN